MSIIENTTNCSSLDCTASCTVNNHQQIIFIMNKVTVEFLKKIAPQLKIPQLRCEGHCIVKRTRWSIRTWIYAVEPITYRPTFFINITQNFSWTIVKLCSEEQIASLLHSRSLKCLIPVLFLNFSFLSISSLFFPFHFFFLSCSFLFFFFFSSLFSYFLLFSLIFFSFLLFSSLSFRFLFFSFLFFSLFFSFHFFPFLLFCFLLFSFIFLYWTGSQITNFNIWKRHRDDILAEDNIEQECRDGVAVAAAPGVRCGPCCVNPLNCCNDIR